MNAKKPKPTKAIGAAADLIAYLKGVFGPPKKPPEPPGPAVFCSTITLHADRCCLEGLFFAMQVAFIGQTLSERQMHCVQHLLSQVVKQVPEETRRMVQAAARYAAKRSQDNTTERLFAAAMTSPSKN